MPEPASARIATQRPLLRAGLERIARAADVAVVEDEPADFVLRSVESGSGEADLDIAITDGVCVVTCRRPPNTAVWDAVWRIIAVTGAS